MDPNSRVGNSGQIDDPTHINQPFNVSSQLFQLNVDVSIPKCKGRYGCRRVGITKTVGGWYICQKTDRRKIQPGYVILNANCFKTASCLMSRTGVPSKLHKVIRF